MKDLVKELLSFDETLSKQNNIMLKKTAQIRSTADENHEQTFTLKKEEVTSIKNDELKKLKNYFDVFEEKEKKAFLNLKNKLTQNKNLTSFIEDVVTTIKKDLCEKKEF